jgi:hypothetical protein
LLRWRITGNKGDYQSFRDAISEVNRDVRVRCAAFLLDEEQYESVQDILRSESTNGDALARLPFSLAAFRRGDQNDALRLYGNVQRDLIPIGYVRYYAKLATLLALGTKDRSIRESALRAIGELPPSSLDHELKAFVGEAQSESVGTIEQ